MKRFRFPLGTVMDYKQQVLEAMMEEYAAALEQVHRQERAVEDCHRRYAATNCEYREKKQTGLTVAEALGYQTGLRLLEEEIERQQERLDALRRIAEERREHMVEAKKDKASLEKLQEKKLDLYNKELVKQEERMIDEMVSASWGQEART